MVGALDEKRPLSFLWSLGEYGSDTGFGKTAMLRRVEGEINPDWGKNYAGRSRCGRIYRV